LDPRLRRRDRGPIGAPPAATFTILAHVSTRWMRRLQTREYTRFPY
jgi:hypothetical protein